MGIIEIDSERKQIIIGSHIFLYGNSISERIRLEMEQEINQMWNEPRGIVWLNQYPFLLEFQTKVFLYPNLTPADVLSNQNPRNNYIRVEEFAHGNISFVDGLGSNTGYFKLENLYTGSTTSAHEYGHTLGLPHPLDLDIRGEGVPGIMYPRGTLVDPQFQYEPSAKPGEKGGTLHPIHRRVHQKDINDLQVERILAAGKNVIGKKSSIFHEAHTSNN